MISVDRFRRYAREYEDRAIWYGGQVVAFIEAAIIVTSPMSAKNFESLAVTMLHLALDNARRSQEQLEHIHEAQWIEEARTALSDVL